MRLFYGLSLPEEIRGETARLAALAGETIPGRYALPSNHHITLAFLGEVAPERVKEAEGVLARCAAAFPAPKVTLCGFGFFGREENAILTLTAESEPSLSTLNRALRAALDAAQLPIDPGPFSPHVTLARRARITGHGLPALHTPIAFTAAHAHLFLSARDHENILRYTPIFTTAFAESGI